LGLLIQSVLLLPIALQSWVVDRLVACVQDAETGAPDLPTWRRHCAPDGVNHRRRTRAVKLPVVSTIFWALAGTVVLHAARGLGV